MRTSLLGVDDVGGFVMKYLYALLFCLFFTIFGGAIGTFFPKPVEHVCYKMCNHQIDIKYIETKNGNIKDIGKGYIDEVK